jgi:hypothetical protein
VSVSGVGRIAIGVWDEIGIAAVLVHFALTGAIADDDAYVLMALRRSRNDLADATRVELRDYLSDLDEGQMRGVVNNVKGIAHEIYFVEAENADGDSVTAEMFPDTNHPDYDVILRDASTGEERQVQLKATSSASYVRETVDELGADSVFVTDEVARSEGLTSTGITNKALTSDVRGVVGHLVDAPTPMNYLPVACGWALAMLLLVLTWRLFRGRISGLGLVRSFAFWGVAKIAVIAAILTAFGVAGWATWACVAVGVKVAYVVYRSRRTASVTP